MDAHKVRYEKVQKGCVSLEMPRTQLKVEGLKLTVMFCASPYQEAKASVMDDWRDFTRIQEMTSKMNVKTRTSPKKQNPAFYIFLLFHSGDQPNHGESSVFRKYPQSHTELCRSNLDGHTVLKLTQLVNCHNEFKGFPCKQTPENSLVM